MWAVQKTKRGDSKADGWRRIMVEADPMQTGKNEFFCLNRTHYTGNGRKSRPSGLSDMAQTSVSSRWRAQMLIQWNLKMAVISLLYSLLPSVVDGYEMAHTKIRIEMMLKERAVCKWICACTNTQHEWYKKTYKIQPTVDAGFMVDIVRGHVLNDPPCRADSLFRSFGSDWFRFTVPRFWFLAKVTYKW